MEHKRNVDAYRTGNSWNSLWKSVKNTGWTEDLGKNRVYSDLITVKLN